MVRRLVLTYSQGLAACRGGGTIEAQNNPPRAGRAGRRSTWNCLRAFQVLKRYAGSLGLSRWRIIDPVLKVGMAFWPTEMASPVRGLRAARASRLLTANTPKSRSSTRSPRASAAVMVSKMASG